MNKFRLQHISLLVMSGARLNKSIAQYFILADLARIFINLSWNDITVDGSTITIQQMICKKPITDASYWWRHLSKLYLGLTEINTILITTYYRTSTSWRRRGLKRGEAQWFRITNLARIFFNLSWYDIIYHFIMNPSLIWGYHDCKGNIYRYLRSLCVLHTVKRSMSHDAKLTVYSLSTLITPSCSVIASFPGLLVSRGC